MFRSRICPFRPWTRSSTLFRRAMSRAASRALACVWCVERARAFPSVSTRQPLSPGITWTSPVAMRRSFPDSPRNETSGFRVSGQIVVDVLRDALDDCLPPPPRASRPERAASAATVRRPCSSADAGASARTRLTARSAGVPPRSRLSHPAQAIDDFTLLRREPIRLPGLELHAPSLTSARSR